MTTSEISQLFSSDQPMDRVDAARKAPDYGNTYVAELITLLDDDFYEVRAYSCKSLGKLNIQRAHEMLETLLFDEVEEVRYSAAKGLGYLGNDDSIPALTKALCDHSRETRRQVVNALKKMTTEMVGDHFKLHLSTLTDEDYEQKSEENIKNIDIARGIMEACAELSGKWITDVLNFGLESEDLEMARLASISIGEKKLQEFYPKLKDLADHKDDDFRLSVIFALSHLEFDGKKSFLLKYSQDSFEFIRELIAKNIGPYIEDQKVIQTLEDLSNDNVSFVREAVAETLSNNPAQINLLQELLGDDRSAVRKAAAKSLGNIANSKAEDLLKSRLEEEDDELVKIAIKNSIKQL